MTREEQIKAIYGKIAKVKSIFIEVCPNCYSKNIGFSNNKEYRNKCKDCNDLFHNPTEIEGEEFKEVMIGDVLDYIDRNLFRNPSKYEGVFEIDIQAREKCVITLYNHFIGKYRSPVEKLDDNAIEFIYNLIKE